MTSNKVLFFKFFFNKKILPEAISIAYEVLSKFEYENFVEKNIVF